MAVSNNNILELMIERATNPSEVNVDELAVQIFCVTVRSDPSLIHKATVLLITKIRSPNEKQSIRALSLLEECMAKCGSSFQDEVSKFRFLNELIRLVSKGHQGEKTPQLIRDKIMDCFLLWTTEYPERNKIREAYDMLRKEGNNHTPVTAPNKRENIMGIDEEKFRKLLQSRNAEDLKRANLLVQSRVSQNARKMELVCRHKTELEQIQNTFVLLNQMLDSYENNEKEREDDSISLIRELYQSCENYLPIVERLPELIDNTNEDLIVETLDINERLRAVIERFKITVPSEENTEPLTPNVASPQPTAALGPLELFNDLFAQPIETSEAENLTESSNPLDELSEIFGQCANSTSTIQESVFGNMDLLEPVTVAMTDQNDLETESENKPQKYDYDSSRLKDIDILSEELLKENLKTSERIGTFKKEPEKISLNDLAKEKTAENLVKQTIISQAEPIDSVLLDSNISQTNIITKTNEYANTDTILDNLKESILPEEQKLEKSLEMTTEEKIVPVVRLADIDVDLDDVSPTNEKLLLDDDIKVTLNFTSNRPSPNVSVIVISVTNQSKLPVTNFQFHASVRKPSKVRLLPATGDSMPAKKPFRPPSPINQIMLLLNPTKIDLDVTCIVGYKLGDDPDPIKESIVAKSIPYVE